MAQMRARHDSTFNGDDCQAANAYLRAIETFPSPSAFHAQLRNCLSFGKTGAGVKVQDGSIGKERRLWASCTTAVITRTCCCCFVRLMLSGCCRYCSSTVSYTH